MIINRPNLERLRTGFKTTFQQQLDQAKPMYPRVSMRVNSSTGKETYGWLGKIPSVRQWLGDRHVQNLMEHDYVISNLDYELTIGVDRNHIQDDELGIYTPIFQQFGDSVAAWPDELVWGLLAAGFTTACYDGQYFFDTDHPRIVDENTTVSVANTDGGSGTPWFLIDASKAVKPIIWQVRKQGEFVALDNPNDENVFRNKTFEYGWDGRGNVGFGLWQFAWGSKQTLNKANYKIAREAMMAFKGDYGRPLNVKPNLLVVPPSLEGQALEILNAQRDAAGATNVYEKTAELLVVPWLA
ncbi:MAG: Mu-like prophage major head subunit gpT family protein [Nitratireductor sp.]|nr:Mu-like prophage major head subunit gpT family protein [Nitratireductor sp.]